MSEGTLERRVPHVLPRKDLVLALAPTYSAALGVDDDEAQSRLAQALARPDLLGELHAAIAGALREAKGPRTSDDAIVDKLSAGVAARRARVRAAPAGPALSAVLVRLNLEIGAAPEQMRATLSSERGRALLDAGLRELAAHVVKELLR